MARPTIILKDQTNYARGRGHDPKTVKKWIENGRLTKYHIYPDLKKVYLNTEESPEEI